MVHPQLFSAPPRHASSLSNSSARPASYESARRRALVPLQHLASGLIAGFLLLTFWFVDARGCEFPCTCSKIEGTTAYSHIGGAPPDSACLNLSFDVRACHKIITKVSFTLKFDDPDCDVTGAVGYYTNGMTIGPPDFYSAAGDSIVVRFNQNIDSCDLFAFNFNICPISQACASHFKLAMTALNEDLSFCTDTVDVYPTCLDCPGIHVDTTSRHGSMEMHPNPTHGSISVHYMPTMTGTVSFDLYSPEGRRIETIRQDGIAGKPVEVLFDTEQLRSGIYYCRMQQGTSAATRILAVTK